MPFPLAPRFLLEVAEPAALLPFQMAIPFAIVGGLLLRAVAREWRATPAIGRLEACSP